MSKAFTKDENTSEPALRPLGPALPSGSKNYLTAEGMATLRQRIRDAEAEVERCRLRHEGAELEQAIEQLTFLGGRLQTSEVVGPPDSEDGPIRFGAKIDTTDADGRQRRFHIVGIDEARPAEGVISWTSPIARALLGRLVGDEVSVQTPHGALELEIRAVHYG
jgi:transcription elongation factor GreB